MESVDKDNNKFKKKVNKNKIKKMDKNTFIRAKQRLIVPPVADLLKIWDEYHVHKGGSGANKIRKSLNNHFKITYADKWVLYMKKNCQACQQWQTDTKLAKPPMKLYQVPKTAWRRVHVDSFGPFPISALGNKRVVVGICSLTGYVEAMAIPEKSEEYIGL